MMRFDLINRIIERLGYESYLEVGVFDTQLCFDRVQCARKEGLDPFPRTRVTYVTTSDQGFLYLRHCQKRYDLIFIDGYHQEFQADRDICNSLQVLSENGTIVLHDANPALEIHTADYVFLDGQINVLHPSTDAFSGTVYRSIVKYNRLNEGHAYVVDSDTGCAVIHKCSRKDFQFDFAPLKMTFDEFDRNRATLLNLVPPSDLDLKLEQLVAQYPLTFKHSTAR